MPTAPKGIPKHLADADVAALERLVDRMLPAEDEMMKWPSFDGRFYYGKVFASVLKNINFVLIKSVIYGKKQKFPWKGKR